MNSYAYDHFTDAKQSQMLPQQQQPNVQTQLPKSQQQNIGNQLGSQNKADMVIPFDFENQQQQKGIIDRNLFMFEIALIYIVQYSLQLSLCYGLDKFAGQFFQLLTVTQARCVILIIVILFFTMPIIIPCVSQWRNHPSSLVVSIFYLFIYSCVEAFFASLIGLHDIGIFAWVGPFGTFGLYNVLFNMIGIVILLALLIMLKATGDSFKFNQFQFVGVVLSILLGLAIGNQSNFWYMFVAIFAGCLFTFTFSSALAKASSDNSGLRQDQTIFASFAVFIMMVFPCINKV